MVIWKKRWIVGLASLVIAIGLLGLKCEEEPSELPATIPVKSAEVIVPELRNNTVDAARLIADESDLLFEVVGEEESLEFPEGHICRQNPMRGSKVNRRISIKVWVSKGPGEEVAPPKKEPATVRVPSVIGMKVERAKQAILAAGLRVGRVYTEPTTEHYEYTVFRQYPRPGKRVVRGSRVNLTVAAALP